MKKNRPIEHEFVEFIPNERGEFKLYVSVKYRTAVHNCFCGCGSKIVTPINPAGWQLGFDGDSVSLYPSVGSWSLPCRSHYWIRSNKVIWAGDMSDELIKMSQSRDQAAWAAYFGQEATAARPEPSKPPRKLSFWKRLLRL